MMFGKIMSANKQPEISGASSVGITEIGRREALKQISQGIEFEILALLMERSPRTVRNLAEDLNKDISDLKVRLVVMERGKLITINNQGLGC